MSSISSYANIAPEVSSGPIRRRNPSVRVRDESNAPPGPQVPIKCGSTGRFTDTSVIPKTASASATS